jgi:DNA-binding transcriptional regulator GbsR (MarR family)
MTPLYKARMENLAEQPRKILAHIMEHWEPIALGDLGQLSGIPNTTLSGQIKRLVQEGLLETVKLPGTRRNGYQASERLFNIWYLMRYTSRWVRQKLTWLIEFMRLWYSTDELNGLAMTHAQAHLWLNNQDAARLALENLAQAASTGDTNALSQLRRKTCEVSAVNQGLALSELMASCRYADFLQPMILALRAADNIPDALEGAAAEIKAMASEVLADILAYRKS